MVRKAAVAFLSLWALASCGVGEDDAIIGEAHKAVGALLKDPESARFDDSNAQVYADDGLVCGGSVNAKNSFGGYVGAQEYSFKRGSGAVLGTVGDSVEATNLFGECTAALSKKIKRDSTAAPAI